MLRSWKWMGGACLAAAIPLVAMTQDSPGSGQQTQPTITQLPPVDGPNTDRSGDPSWDERGGTVIQGGAHSRPGQVQRYLVECPDSTTCQVQVADCCIAGDHWEATVKIWDNFPNSATTTAGGVPGVFSAPAIANGYGVPKGDGLIAMIEVRYLHGINDFGAGWSLRITTTAGACAPVVTDLGIEDEL